MKHHPTMDELAEAWRCVECAWLVKDGKYFVPDHPMTYCQADDIRTYFLILAEATLAGDLPCD